MCLTFSEHVRNFGHDCDPVTCVFPQLEKLLRKRMRRRGLLNKPPKYLGYNVKNWNADGVFEEIVVDCYIFAVVARIKGLRNQLLVRPNIDGLITRNVDNFLLERQSRSDPIGYAVFGNLEAAVKELAAAGQASVEDIEVNRLKSASLITLGSGLANVSHCEAVRLQEALTNASGWADVLPDLIKCSDEGQAWMSAFLRDLISRKIACVRVSDVVSTIATRARRDWALRHASSADELGLEGDDDFSELVRLVWPDEAVVISDLLETIKRVVPERIGDDQQLRVRNGLTAVFNEWIIVIEESGISRPNQADLALRLGMSDATLSDYLKRLRKIIEKFLPENSED